MTRLPPTETPPIRRLLRTISGHPASDAELVRQFFEDRSESAFAELVRRHGPMVAGTCRRVVRDRDLAHDAAQATFLVLAKRSRSLGNVQSIAGWLHGVACRCALKALRKVGRPEVPTPDPPEQAVADHEVERREVEALIDEEVRLLRQSYREVVVLHYFRGLGYAEIARTLGCPVGTVATHLARARERLRARLARRGWDTTLGLGAVLAGLTAPGVPEAWAKQTATAARALVSGQVCPVDPGVFELYQGASMMIVIGKWKVGAAVAVALLGFGLATGQDATAPVGGPADVAEAAPDGPAARDFADPAAVPEDVRAELMRLFQAQIGRMDDSQLREFRKQLLANEREARAKAELEEALARLRKVSETYPDTDAGRRAAQLLGRPTMSYPGMAGMPSSRPDTPPYDALLPPPDDGPLPPAAPRTVLPPSLTEEMRGAPTRTRSLPTTPQAAPRPVQTAPVPSAPVPTAPGLPPAAPAPTPADDVGSPAS